MRNEEVIRRPITLTEKASALREEGKLVFEVARTANRAQVRAAVEKLFGVKVASVNTCVVRGKERRMGRGYAKLQNWKKAIVTLRAGEAVNLWDGQ